MPVSNEPSTAVKAYYRAKPYLPWWLRIRMRRVLAEGLRKKYANTWPIDESSDTPPSWWSGWPDEKKFSFLLTHDVESPAGLERVKDLAELEMELGFRSSFNFVPEGSYRVPDELRHWLTEHGFEVGVHDLEHDGRLYDSREDFEAKAKKINKYLKDWEAVGFRSGFMLRNLEWLQDLEIRYDASTFDTDPFEPQPDGVHTIFPFLIGRKEGEDSGGYVELPYTLPQDSTLFLLLGESNADIWLQKLKWVASKGGMAMINIHPDYIDFGSAKSPKKLYSSSLLKNFLSEVSKRYEGSYWNPLPKDLASWVLTENSGGRDVQN